jgi:hypothetical protein
VRLRSEALALVACALAFAVGPSGASETGSFAVIVAGDVPLTDISFDELRRVFVLKRVFWKPGKQIRVVLPGTGLPARAFLLERVCQKTEGELRRLVLESTYRGETDQPPKVASSEEDALRLVSSLPSAVALVTAEAPLPPGVKTLRVDGKLPADQGYPLAR